MGEQTNTGESTEQDRTDEFAREAAEGNAGLVSELIDLIRYNKKWWLIPVIVALALIGVVVLLGTTPAAPFIYQLF